MIIVSVVLAALCLLVLILVLAKLLKSEKEEEASASRQAQLEAQKEAQRELQLQTQKEASDEFNKELKETLRRQEQALTVVSTKLEMMKVDSDKLSKTVDAKLEEMRATVEEKLQSTLERRLSSSFGQVGQQLENVYKQLGEVQILAKDVGNLERVLTNVKTRGIWGELQAERILQDMLLPEQYDKNVATKKGSLDKVEFAVKLPGANEGDKIYLPIDSKFPREDYERLCQATERADKDSVTALRKNLGKRIEAEAKDIRDKYIDVPHTTDFAILFLPVEGLYAEVLSLVGLQEKLQREFHVMIAGPATLSALLNSLQMGFRTLAIEKKSSEVWKLLGEVKTEYAKFGQALDGIKKKLALATSEIDNAFVRHRALERRLRGVEALKDTTEPRDNQEIAQDISQEDLDES